MDAKRLTRDRVVLVGTTRGGRPSQRLQVERSLLAVGVPIGLDNGEKKSRARRNAGLCRGERR